MNRCVISIAVGKKYYLELAANLLRSFLLWNKDIDILLLTDDTTHFAAYTDEARVHIKHIELPSADKSFTVKFRLFEHAMASENLFIDCDCLVYRDLNPVFDKMGGQSFTAIGYEVTSGDFFCDVAPTIKKLNIPYMPKFVGSVYYFKNNTVAKNIFYKAGELKQRYDELGFLRLRGKENEEPLFAVAMAMQQQTTIPDDGDIKADTMFFDYWHCNVLKGKAYLGKWPDGKPTNREPSDLKDCEPAIVHYNDSDSEFAVYLTEQYRLKHQNTNHMINQAVVWLRYMLPEKITFTFKDLLRPIYHFIAGPKAVVGNKRVVE